MYLEPNVPHAYVSGGEFIIIYLPTYLCMYVYLPTYLPVYVCIYLHRQVGSRLSLYVYLPTYLPTYLCIYLSISTYLSIYLCIYLPTYLCVYLPMYLSISTYLSTYLCMYISPTYLCMYIYVCISHLPTTYLLSVYIFIYILSLYLSINQSSYLPVCMYIYLSLSLSDVIECMANSDNVVRAGLTPKFRDKDTLCEILSFISKPAEEQIFPSKPHPSSPGVTIYDPPSPEFSIARFEFKDPFQTPATNGPSIFLVLTGSGNIEGTSSLKTSYCHGDVIFVPAMNIIKFVPGENTVLFQGYCEF